MGVELWLRLNNGIQDERQDICCGGALVYHYGPTFDSKTSYSFCRCCFLMASFSSYIYCSSTLFFHMASISFICYIFCMALFSISCMALSFIFCMALSFTVCMALSFIFCMALSFTVCMVNHPLAHHHLLLAARILSRRMVECRRP